LLPGLTNPSQAATLAPAWSDITSYLVGLGGAGGDVIVDAGQLAGAAAPWPLIAAADRVAVVVRTTLRSIAAAAPVLDRLRDLDESRPPALITVDGGDYRPAEVGKRLGASVLATLPWESRDAAALSDGHGLVGARTSLLRAVRTASRAFVDRAPARPAVPAPAAA
jgi:hypothetical protein